MENFKSPWIKANPNLLFEQEDLIKEIKTQPIKPKLGANVINVYDGSGWVSVPIKENICNTILCGDNYVGFGGNGGSGGSSGRFISKKEEKTFDILLPRANDHIVYKTGAKISVIMYMGSNQVEVEALLNFLKAHKDKNKPLPLKNTDFNMKIDDVITETNEDFLKMTTHYRVILKGELL